MISFSVNPSVYSEMAGVTKLLADGVRTDREREYLGEAYLKIIEGKGKENINLGAYSAACEKNSQLARAKKNEVSLLSSDEMTKGFKGVTELVSDCVDTSIDAIIESADTHSYVESFIDMKEYIYLEEGKDIWRLLQLVFQGDGTALRKLKEVIAEFEGLGELLGSVVKNPKIRKELMLIYA